MKSITYRLALAAAIVLLLGVAPASAQFGQNKVTYEHFDWQVYHSPHFDVHYYPSMEPFLEQLVSYAESSYVDLSTVLDHELRFRVPLVLYKTHGEFQQTNITLQEIGEGTGAFAEPVQYRMVLPIDMPPDELYKLISHELTHIFEFSIFFEGYLGRALRSRPPTWLMEGLASYLADDESTLDQMIIRDFVVNRNLPPLQAFAGQSFLAYRYGHAVFDYIEQEHGIEGLRSFLFEFKKVLLTGNLSRAVKEAFGYDVEEFNRRLNRYLRKKYYRVLLEKKSPDEQATEIRPLKSRPPLHSPTLSPSGELVASLGQTMETDLLIFSVEGEDKARNITKGFTNKYRYLSSAAYEGKRDLSWSPVADEIAVFARKENKWPLLIIDALSGKIRKKIEFDNIYQCASPTFSPDGRRIAFEGNRDGVVDIFEYDLDSGEIRNLTQDDFYDANPWYSADGKSMVYNRRIGPHWKIFSVDMSDPERKSQLTYGAHSDLQPSYSRDGNTVFFTSDRGEYRVYNVHSLDLTTGDVAQYTDVVGGTFMPIEMSPRGEDRYVVFNAWFEGTFRLYRMPLRAPQVRIPAEERLNLAAEAAEPFKSDLSLTVDEEQKNKYKLQWDIEAPSISVGVADDGTFLTNSGIQFTDLLGNHRIFVNATSVSDFVSLSAQYVNLTRRYNWGGSVFDFREYYVDRATGQQIERASRTTGVSSFIEHPISRHYRVRGSLGLQDSSFTQLAGYNQIPPINPGDLPIGFPLFQTIDDKLAVGTISITGDTTRWQRWGPYHGKRFNLGYTYGKQLSGDFSGDFSQANFDIRTYGRVTKRSLFAWRLSGVKNLEDREYLYSFGGINQLRGYEYRDFVGSNLLWTNLEFRFPLIDLLAFPVLAIQDIRGLFFLDVGGAYLDDDQWIDPLTGLVRADPGGQVIEFKAWDSDNNRLQDLRGAYGMGLNFRFLGGLQLNFIWAKRMPYTAYPFDFNTFTYGAPIEVDTSSTEGQFYITYDF